MADKHLIVLGAGPAGLGAAYKLRKTGLARVTVLERNARVGGNAGSFELAGMQVDYGSHRLHPACDPDVFADIQALLGEDLLDRPRHGRIRLRNRWIHFPLKPADLALRLPPAFALGVGRDVLGKLFRMNGRSSATDTFASVMERGLGTTICRDFYFPYARKIWGLEPEELAVTQARRRVANNSLGKMAGKVITALPGLKPKGSGRFFYPREGYGQISEAYASAAREYGAEIALNADVKAVRMPVAGQPEVEFVGPEGSRTLAADQVWSTIPITVLARILDPAPPAVLLEAAAGIDYRAMILVYLVLGQPQFSEYDAHYFPGMDIPITRLSEPKIYRAGLGPSDRTVLCAELPCSPDNPEWLQEEGDLGELVCQALARAGIPVSAPVEQVFVRKLRFAYPIYRRGYDRHFERLDEWVSQFDRLLTFGRQGLFAHDNTHHALYMAYSAVDCLDVQGNFDWNKWQAYRKIFDTHVVVD